MELKQENSTNETEESTQKASVSIKWITDYYSRLEKFGIALSLAAYAMQEFGAEQWPLAIGIGLTIFAIILFLGAYRTKDLPPEIFGLIFANVSHIGSSVGIVGVMFGFLNLPGTSDMLGIALMTLTIVSPFLTYKWIASSPKYKPYAIRAMMILGICVIMFIKYSPQLF